MLKTPLDAPPDMVWGSIGGVHAFWCDSREALGPDRFVGGVTFRVGAYDERLPFAGITHLVEHLSLGRLGDRSYHYNGSVDGLYTSFYASGREDEVFAFLEQALAGVARLDTARLGTEAKLIGVEAEQRQPGIDAALLRVRFGIRAAYRSTARPHRSRLSPAATITTRRRWVGCCST